MSLGEVMKQIKGLNIKEIKLKAEQGEQRQIITLKLVTYLVKITLKDASQKEAFETMIKELEK